MILNCLSSPLKTLKMYWDNQDASSGTGASQASFPAIIDSSGASNAHQIPAACSYPSSLKQPAGPPKMAGLGVYRFNCGSRPLRDNCFGGAIAFSYKENGAAPFLGVSFYWDGTLYTQTNPTVKCSVTTKLANVHRLRIQPRKFLLDHTGTQRSKRKLPGQEFRSRRSRPER